MTALITILISLLGYGTPADYANHSEAQLQNEITLASDGSLGDHDIAG